MLLTDIQKGVMFFSPLLCLCNKQKNSNRKYIKEKDLKFSEFIVFLFLKTFFFPLNKSNVSYICLASLAKVSFYCITE